MPCKYQRLIWKEPISSRGTTGMNIIVQTNLLKGYGVIGVIVAENQCGTIPSAHSKKECGIINTSQRTQAWGSTLNQNVEIEYIYVSCPQLDLALNQYLFKVERQPYVAKLSVLEGIQFDPKLCFPCLLLKHVKIFLNCLNIRYTCDGPERYEALNKTFCSEYVMRKVCWLIRHMGWIGRIYNTDHICRMCGLGLDFFKDIWYWIFVNLTLHNYTI